MAEKLGILLRKESISVTVCNTLKDAVEQAFSVAKEELPLFSAQALLALTCLQVILSGNLFNQVFFDLKKRYTPCTQEESI